MRKGVALAWASLLLPCSAADWLRIRTAQIEILTDAGEKAGRATLERLEQIHAILVPRDREPLPLRVFVFESEKEFRSFTDTAVSGGFYRNGADRDFIVLHSGAGLPRATRHEYIHLVLNRASGPLPLWFEEGTAELYSNIDIQHVRIIIGQPIPEHVSLLNTLGWLSPDRFIRVNRHSPIYDEQTLAGMFYAESWALVHMLNLAPGWREEMPRFAELLADGRDGDEALLDAFGKSIGQALEELRGYMGRLRAVTLDNATRNELGTITVDRMSPVEANFARADLALHVRHVDLARDLTIRAKKSQPNSPLGEAGLGSLALVEDRPDEARAHFERALALGSRDPEVCFQLAMLERDSRGSRQRVDDLLMQAIGLDANFGEAHFILGVEASDDGDFPKAIDHLRAAARALPRRSYVWHALALAQSKAGQIGEARLSASRAEKTANTAQEEGMAEALLDSLR